MEAVASIAAAVCQANEGRQFALIEFLVLGNSGLHLHQAHVAAYTQAGFPAEIEVNAMRSHVWFLL